MTKKKQKQKNNSNNQKKNKKINKNKQEYIVHIHVLCINSSSQSCILHAFIKFQVAIYESVPDKLEGTCPFLPLG